MLLSDQDIQRAINPVGRHSPDRRLVIERMAEDAIKPASIDLMLSNHFWVFMEENTPTPHLPGNDIDPRQDQTNVGRDIYVDDGAYFLLGPGEFVLGSTRERFTFPAHLAGRVEGKSSIGRLGIMVHVTAGFFDPGFSGYPTLELVNVRRRPIRLYPGMPIAQMSVFAMESPSRVPYDRIGKYAGQGERPAPSRYHENFQSAEV